MERVTDQKLNYYLGRINSQSKQTYSLEYAMGGVKLLRDDSFEITQYRHTKKEMYLVLLAMANFLDEENRGKK
jgi:hypothetical protein